MAFTIAVFGLARLAGAWENSLARLRDAVGAVNLNRTGVAVRQMEQLQRDLAAITRDARPLLRGIGSVPEWVWDHVHTFLPFDELDRGRRPIFHSMAETLVKRSDRLLADEEEIRTTVNGISTLAAASANLSAARANVRLQWVAIIVAVIALLVSTHALPRIRDAVSGRAKSSPHAAARPDSGRS
jgi:hypothetical protein